MFEVGQRVIIKNNFWDIPAHVGVNSEMKKFAGHEFVVCRYYDVKDKLVILSGNYELFDSVDWIWDVLWLEPAVEYDPIDCTEISKLLEQGDSDGI